MTKAKFRNGDVVRITLPMELGFSYAKCINLLEIDSNSQYPILIRVYNHRFLDSKEGARRFDDKELILCPLLIAGILPAIARGIWKIVGNLPISDDDKIIPHYKRAEPDEENVKEWYYLIDADISKKVKSTYENIKHLEFIGAVGSELVGTKIGMALLHDEGKRIEDYFELKEYFEKKFYKEVTEKPAYYKLPEKIRGKAKTA